MCLCRLVKGREKDSLLAFTVPPYVDVRVGMYADLPPEVVSQLVQARDAEVQKVIKRFHARAKEQGLSDGQHKEVVATTTGYLLTFSHLCWTYCCAPLFWPFSNSMCLAIGH